MNTNTNPSVNSAFAEGFLFCRKVFEWGSARKCAWGRGLFLKKHQPKNTHALISNEI